jgi:plastocyanin
VPAPDESKSYALAQPTPVGQAAATVTLGGTVTMIEPTTPTDWGFDPKMLTIQVGQAVRFTNSGKIAHTATQSQGVFDTGFVQGGQSATLTFDTPGTFTFFCQPHPWMQGTIVVEGQAGTAANAAAAVAGTAEENQPRPTISPVQATAFIVVIIALVFGLGFVATRSKRGVNRQS